VRQKRGRNTFATPRLPFNGKVSVLVPAYNEELVICKTISALRQSTYGRAFEIIVIDDGSTDRTAEVVRTAFQDDDRVKVLRKENGGKAAALNFGLANTEADVVVAIDGDTVLMPDAIDHLVAPFAGPSVGAVAGTVVVGNKINLITQFQALEYVTSQALDRCAFERFNAIGVVPGAIGAWRRDAVIAVGGYSTNTLAEDADLTLSLQRAGWHVVTAPAACAMTEAPETLQYFLKQRFRWMFGTLQVAYKHSSAILERPCGVSLITIPNVYVFQFGFTLLAPIMDLLLLWTLVLSLASIIGFAEPQGATLSLIAKYWVFFQTIDFSVAALGVALNGDKIGMRLLPLLLLQRFTYRQLLYWTAVRALFAAIKGAFVGWGKLVRTGGVDVPVFAPRLNSVFFERQL
jgi:cellulose synthase/poly-beta-1,6-N-acetylglucosamine synthase-like glycosyltransferase